MSKRYCVAERWVVEVRYYVDADSESEAASAIQDMSPAEEEYLEVSETIIDEV